MFDKYGFKLSQIVYIRSQETKFKLTVPRHPWLKRKSNRTNRNIEILPKDSKNDHKCTQTL